MKKVRKSFFNSNLGFSLMESLVVVAVSSIVLAGSSYLVVDSQKVEKNQEKLYWLLDERLVIQRALQNEGNWTNIKASNPNMNCIDNNTSCFAFKTPQKMALPMGAEVLDGNLPTMGLDSKGRLCTQYDDTVGNENCPFGVNVTWQALCNDSDCKKAQPKMQVTFKMKDPRAETQMNLDSFSVTAYRDAKLQDLNDVCTKMGGNLSGTTCNIDALTAQCDPSNAMGAGATFPLGFDTAGKVICGKPTITQCASTEVMSGFDGAGNIVCSPVCAPGGGGPALPPPDSCTANWCHLGREFTCTRTNGGASSISGTGNLCGAEDGGANPCTRVNCNMPVTAINCSGHWGACDSTTGKQTFIVDVAASGGGTTCNAPAPGQTKICDVNCVGSWSGCQGTAPSAYKVYSIIQAKQNNGIACPSNGGDRDPSNCNTAVCGELSWCHLSMVTKCTRYSNGTWDQTSTAIGPALCDAPYPPEGSHAGKSCPTSVPVCSTPTPPPPPPADPTDPPPPVACPMAFSCFVAGTKVQMADGKYQVIENIQAGDQVLSYDEVTKTQRYDTVVKPISHAASWQILHHFELMDGTKITSNGEHPFFVLEKDMWLRASEIYKLFLSKEKFSFLNKEHSAVRIKSIQLETKFVPVYNLEVKGLAKTDSHYGQYGRGHNYFVEGILVHNKYAPDTDGTCPAGWFPPFSCRYRCSSPSTFNSTTNECCAPGQTPSAPYPAVE